MIARSVEIKDLAAFKGKKSVVFKAEEEKPFTFIHDKDDDVGTVIPKFKARKNYDDFVYCLSIFKNGPRINVIVKKNVEEENVKENLSAVSLQALITVAILGEYDSPE